MAKTKKFSPPKNLAQCADLLYTTRQRRLELDKEVQDLKDQETQLKERLIAELPKGEASGIAGKVCRVSIIMQTKAVLDDVEKLKKFLIKTNRWDLVYQLRPADRAIKEMWEAGESVPGIIPDEFPFVSVNKL